MALAVGIDLGTTNSVAAVATPTGVEFALGAHGERVHPSTVAYPPGGGVVVGGDARMRRVVDPRNTIYSAKRLIGQNIRSPMVQLALTNLPFQVEEGPNQQLIIVCGDRRMTVPEVSSQVLLHLKRCTERQLGDRVTQAVITVPANFTDAQRQATKEAGRLAGLEVLRLINEPTAAALAYGFGQALDEIVCVFDFGGGTFDVSLLQVRGEIFEVLATDGDFFLGGDDIDRALAEVLAAEVNRQHAVDPRPIPSLMTRLQMAAEEIKFHLSEHATAEGDDRRARRRRRPGPVAAVPAVAHPVRDPDRGLRRPHDRAVPARDHRPPGSTSPRSPTSCASAARPGSRWSGAGWPRCSASRPRSGSTPTRSSPRAPRSRPAAWPASWSPAAAWAPSTRS